MSDYYKNIKTSIDEEKKIGKIKFEQRDFESRLRQRINKIENPSQSRNPRSLKWAVSMGLIIFIGFSIWFTIEKKNPSTNPFVTVLNHSNFVRFIPEQSLTKEDSSSLNNIKQDLDRLKNKGEFSVIFKKILSKIKEKKT